jgi:hypothetical protein
MTAPDRMSSRKILCPRLGVHCAMVVALLSALSATAGEVGGVQGPVFRLPTPAGHYAADVAGEAPLQLVTPGTAESDEAPGIDSPAAFGSPKLASRPSWTLRGGLGPDDVVTRQEDIGIPTDTWSLDRWRFDASVIRTF